MGIATKAKSALTASIAAMVGTYAQSAFAQPNSVLNPLDRPQASANNTDLRSGVISLINYFLGFLGLIAVIVIIFSGVKLVASQGNDGKVKEAQKTILYAALGLLIVFFAYAIVNFIVNVIV